LPTLQRLIAAAGLEMRVRLEPIDYHDDTLAKFLESLPPAQRADLEAAGQERAAAARLRRIRGK
jgi:hypothetical protein